MLETSEGNKFSIDYSWEEKVDFLTNQLILKIIKEEQPELYQNIQNIVKSHLNSQ